MSSENGSFAVSSRSNTQNSLVSSKVGILGAGIGGLYAALILDSLDIEYEILEASDRIGGRISTYKFPGGGEYDYFDMGAMRFPFPKRDSQGRYTSGMMRRFAELTEYGPLNEGQDPLRDSVKPYYFRTRDGAHPGFYYFNGIREPMTSGPKGHFGALEMGIHADYIQAGADAITGDVIRPFVRGLLQDMETGQRDGWETLLAHDSYSLGGYMATKYIPSPHLGLPSRPLPSHVINWCGLLGMSTSNGLVDIVLLLLAISRGGDTWKCFEGGTETLTKKIEAHLNRKGSFIQLNKRVTAISQGHVTIELPANIPDCGLPAGAGELAEEADGLVLENDNILDDPTGSARRRRPIKIPSITVTMNGQEKRDYSHVISTLPPPVLRAVDLNDAGLNLIQRNAVRSLKFKSATKVAILFKSNWWTAKLGIVGGQTVTDLPIGMVVYPSYGLDSSVPSKVLIASFCYGHDADDIGALASPQYREVLRELVLRNLAEVHSGLHPDVTYEYLQDEFVDMHVKDWHRDAYAMGGVASFGPGQFEELYTSLTSPAAGKRLHFAGEAISLCHGWAVGALNSSWRAVHEYLKVTGQDEKMSKFKALWGGDSEWSDKPSSTDNVNGVAE